MELARSRPAWWLLTWTVAACSPPSNSAPVDATSVSFDSAGLGQTRTAFQRAVLANDASGLAAFYADSGTFVVPGLPTLRGRSAIEALFAKSLAAARFEGFEFIPIAVVGGGGLVSEMGRQRDVSRQAGLPAQISYGRYMITWMRSASREWQIVMNATVVDSTTPAPQAAPARPE